MSWAAQVSWLLTVAAVIGVLGARFGRKAPLAVVLVVALAIRVVVAAISYHHTPHDVTVYFYKTGLLVRERHDPLTHLPRFEWNFLPFMPDIYAVVQHLGMGWQDAVKVPAIGADVVVTALVGSFAPERRRAVQWLYATNPVAILVCGVHGQVEPTALALGLGGLLLVRRHPLWAGVLVGLAISAKTWPVLFVFGLARDCPWRAWWRIAVGLAAPIVVFMAETVFYLRDSLHAAVHVLTSYRSLVGTFGWSGLSRLWGDSGAGYAGPRVNHVQSVGTAVTVVSLLIVGLICARLAGADLMTALLVTTVAVSAGFGVQYLLWPTPLVIARLRWAGAPFVVLSAVLAGYFYLAEIPGTGSIRTAIYLSLPVIATMALAVVAITVKKSPGKIASRVLTA